MSKKTKYIEMLRTPRPAEQHHYIEWLEMRCEALTRLRLIEMSNAVDKSVALQNRIYNLTPKHIESNVQVDEGTRKPKNYSGYVYLLKVLNSDTLYKIGRTKNPDNRLRTFSVKLPFPVEYAHVIETDNMHELERDLHRKFRKQRKRGSEFFSLSQADIDYIKSL